MSSPLKQNTTALQELLEKINQLPEAGNSGSGAGGSMFEIGGASRGAKPLPNYNGKDAFLNLESISIGSSFVSVE